MPDHLGNFLGIYNPFTKEQVKALTSLPHQRNSYGYQMSSDFSWYNSDAGTNIDYKAKAGDLSKSSLIMSAVRVVGNTLPEAPLEVKDPGDGKGEAQIVESRLLDLLRKPNPFYAGDALWAAFAFSWIIDGNVYFIKVWNKAATEVVELWYEPHWTIRPRYYGDNLGGLDFREGDDREAFVLYYELNRGGNKYRLEVSDVLHFRDGNDPYNRGLGWSYIRSVYREIYGDNEVSNFSARLVGGSAVPPFLVGIDPSINFTQPDADALANTLERKTSGDNRGKPIVVYGGKPYRLAWSPDEIDLKMLHRFSEERFSAVTGIDPIMTGLGVGHDHSIYNNVSEGRQAYYEAYLKPLLRRIAGQINLQLLPDFESNERLYVAHDLSKISALQEGEDSKSKRVVSELGGGMITLNESRSMRGMETVDGGDVYYIPNTLSVVLASDIGKPVEPVDTNPPAPPVKSIVPPKEIQDEAIDWWKKVAPPDAQDLIDAPTKKANGDSHVIS